MHSFKLKGFLLMASFLVLFAAPVFGGGTWIADNFYTYNVDLSGTTYYIMAITTGGAWYIKAIDTTNTDQFRITYSYVSGDTNYAVAWEDRAVVSGVSRYKTFEEAF